MNGNGKVQNSLKAWCAADGIEFEDEAAKRSYQEKTRRITDVILLKKPDRVPTMPMWEFFYMKYAGYTCRDGMYDAKKAEDATIKTVLELKPDSFQSPIFYMTGPILEALDSKELLWPGHGVDDRQAHQFLEGEYMKANEYRALINDPSDLILRYYFPRVYGNLAPLASAAPIRNSFAYYAMFDQWAHFGTPEGIKALETLKKVGEASLNYLNWLKSCVGKIEAKGYPVWSGSFCLAPFDAIGDTLRGTKGVLLDMFRQPDVLKEACEKFVWWLTDCAISAAKATGNPIVFMPLHKGTASKPDGKGGFISVKQFEEIYWPTLRKVMLVLIDNGLVPNLLIEGDFTSRLDIIKDVPPASCIYHFERVDLEKAKAVLGDRVCIRGSIPIHKMTLGTPEDVKAECQRQFDVLGEGGGYIMDTTVASEQIKPENMRALIEFTKEHCVYT